MPDQPPSSSDENQSPRNRRRPTRGLRLPEVSGKWTVIWLLVCFILTGILIPVVLKLPHWIEYEIVVGVWWIVWTMILTKLLYKGEQITDDHQHKQPRDWLGLQKADASDASGCGYGADFEGCAVLIGLVVALILVWFLIEVAIPIVFLLLYFLVRGMLANVVNEKAYCRGNFTLSAARGFFWATVYTAPLALSIWVIHYIQKKHGG